MAEEQKDSKRRGRPPVLNKVPITLEDRLNYGSVDLRTLSKLCGYSEGKIRLDEKAGLLSFVKVGGCTRVLGPVARKYMGYVAA
jgi:hypothetical protein